MEMTVVQILFYVFSAAAIFSGMMVVASANPVRAVLFLVFAFFATAGVWMLLQAEFLALVLVLVYVGAVMTLFLFVVMMLSIKHISFRKGFVRYPLIGGVMVLLVTALLVAVIGPERFGLINMPAPALQPADYSNLADLGAVLYTNYAYPFEISAVLLLTAIIAAISLTHRAPKDRKIQVTSEQVAVRREDRVRIIKMSPEKKKP